MLRAGFNRTRAHTRQKHKVRACRRYNETGGSNLLVLKQKGLLSNIEKDSTDSVHDEHTQGLLTLIQHLLSVNESVSRRFKRSEDNVRHLEKRVSALEGVKKIDGPVRSKTLNLPTSVPALLEQSKQKNSSNQRHNYSHTHSNNNSNKLQNGPTPSAPSLKRNELPESAQRLLTAFDSLLRFQQSRLEQSREQMVSQSRRIDSLNMLFVGSEGALQQETSRHVYQILSEQRDVKSVEYLNGGGLISQFLGEGFGKFADQYADCVVVIDNLLCTVNNNSHYSDTIFRTFLNVIKEESHHIHFVLCLRQDEVQRVLQVTPEIETLFPLRADFPDLEVDKITEMVKRDISSRGLKLQEDALSELSSYIESYTASMTSKTPNAYLAQYISNNAVVNQAVRLSQNPLEQGPADPKHITPADFSPQTINPKTRPEVLKEAEEELSKLIGMKKVKEILEQLEAVQYARAQRKEAGIPCNDETDTLHMVFKGHPGTGKTTVAEIVAKLLYGLGYLKTGQFITASREDLIGPYVGHSEMRTNNVIKSALGGVLFIDEAYHLAPQSGVGESFSEAVLTTLVEKMELHRKDLVVILAGYPKQMDHLLNTNPGLKSRFPHHLMFDTFSKSELNDIAYSMLSGVPYTISDSIKEKITNVTSCLPSANTEGARGIRNLVQQVTLNHSKRMKKLGRKPTVEELKTLSHEDFANIDNQEKVNSEVRRHVL